jgi:hypothetical protein
LTYCGFVAAFPGTAQEGLGAVSRRVISRSSGTSVSLWTPRRWFKSLRAQKLLLYCTRATQVLRDGVLHASGGGCAAKNSKLPLATRRTMFTGEPAIVLPGLALALASKLVRVRFGRTTLGWLGDQDSNLD